MSIKTLVLLPLVLYAAIRGVSQDAYQSGILPAINLNKKLDQKWSLNLRVESRQTFISGVFKETRELGYNYVLTDASAIFARRIGLYSRLSAGYLLRMESSSPSHRTIQQFTTLQRFSSFRLVHRIAADQTFNGEEAPEFRLRYRISIEKSLNGDAADRKEFYFKLNHEYLGSMQESEYGLEIRLVPLLGYSLTDRQKLEVGPDYRFGNVLETPRRHSFWTCLFWFIEL